MTAAELAAVIFVFCGFNNPTPPTDDNFKCMDYMVNCCVTENGMIKKETVEHCKVEYGRYEKR
jgi:hypothetical protein